MYKITIRGTDMIEATIRNINMHKSKHGCRYLYTEAKYSNC